MKITWDNEGDRLYETGVDRGVLYPYQTGDNPGYTKGVSWSGLTGFTESPSGAESTKIYADNIQYLVMTSAEELGGTITAYQSPEEFDECDGTSALIKGVKMGQQSRKMFGFCYRTKIGNDVSGDEFGYKLHLLYGCKASPSERSYTTVNDSPEAMELSWEITTNPVMVNLDGFKPTSLVTIDSTQVNADKLAKLERILYGFDAAAFDETKTYEVGDYCTHEGKTYKCTTKISTAAAWSADKWEESTDDIARLPLPDEINTIFTAE